MKKPTKSAEIRHAKAVKLCHVAARYHVAASRAATYFAKTGRALYQPGELTRLLRKSSAARAELAAMR